ARFPATRRAARQRACITSRQETTQPSCPPSLREYASYGGRGRSGGRVFVDRNGGGSTMRALFLTLLIIVGAFVAYAYWGGNANWRSRFPDRSVGTSGTLDVQKARERGAELGDKAAAAANKVQETVGEAA